MPQLWSWVISLASLAAAWNVGSGRRSGWTIKLALQVVWVIYSIQTRQWGFLVSTIPFSFVYARNWLRTENRGDDK